MTIIAVTATAVGIFLGLANLPQAIKIFRSKRAQDISLLSFLIIEIGSFVWILYGIDIYSYPIIIPNTLGFFSTSLVLLGYFLYGRRKK